MPRLLELESSLRVVSPNAKHLADGALAQSDDEVDGVGEQEWLARDTGLLDELIDTREGGPSAISVHRAHATWMPGIPRLEHVEGLPPSYLPHDDRVGAEPHRGPHQPREVSDFGAAKSDAVRCRAAELDRVLQN